MRALVLKLFHDEAGATAIEYALMASLIAGAIVVAVGLLGTNVKALYGNIANGVK